MKLYNLFKGYERKTGLFCSFLLEDITQDVVIMILYKRIKVSKKYYPQNWSFLITLNFACSAYSSNGRAFILTKIYLRCYQTNQSILNTNWDYLPT